MRSIVLSGFAGTGKSAIGEALARKLGVPFIDTDAAIERRAGKDIPSIWRELGEGGFRALERHVALDALKGPPSVIAFGGGTVIAREVRFEALDRATVVTLTASVDAIVLRAATGNRPLLAAPDPGQRVVDLLELRADAYAECHATLDTTAVSIDGAVDRLAALRDDDALVVPLGRRSHLYRRVDGSHQALSDAVAALGPSGTLVVTDENVARLRAKALARVGDHIVLPAGEAYKNLSAVSLVWDRILKTGLDRNAVIVAFGGGVIGDMAGFAASTALRGLRWVQAPTTLLSMVDASIGGKTGFDHETGKNRIGSIHQPSAIIADIAHLETLPEREVRAGLAEVVKIAVACDAALFEDLERGIPHADTILRSAAAKIRIVRVDENERAGLRAVLNLGHTVGHALEAEGNYTTHLHGEAVAMGLVHELEAMTRLGHTPVEVMTRVKALLVKLGLPVNADDAMRSNALARIGTDKKRIGSSIEIPIVTGIGTSRVEHIPLPTFRQALA